MKLDTMIDLDKGTFEILGHLIPLCGHFSVKTPLIRKTHLQNHILMYIICISLDKGMQISTMIPLWQENILIYFSIWCLVLLRTRQPLESKIIIWDIDTHILVETCPATGVNYVLKASQFIQRKKCKGGTSWGIGTLDIFILWWLTSI